MRVIWKGTLVFGRVAIPVGLVATRREGDVAFRTLHRECATPVKERRWCPFHERLVEDGELVKGWEIAPGQFLLVESEELAAVAPDARDRRIAITGFVDAEDVDPLWVRSSYYLAPGEQLLAQRAYALLVTALLQTESAAIARFVAWGSEQLCAVRRLGSGRALVLQTLVFPADVVPPTEIEEALADAEVQAEEAELALELVGRLSTRVDRLDLSSRQRPRVQALLEDKLAGRDVVTPERPAGDVVAPTLDLADALRRSIREAPRRRRTKAKTAR